MINSIVGLMNSGKTLYMTYKLYLAYCSGKKIISNYDLNFPHHKINRDWLISMANKDNTVLDNVAIGLDELWIWLDARESQKNSIATYFFLQSSKADTEIYLTAQHNDQNDKRIRQNLHKVTQCSRVIFEKNKFVPISDDNRFLKPEQENKLYIKAVEFKRVNIGFFTEIVPSKTFYIYAKSNFKLYDTRQKILKQ